MPRRSRVCVPVRSRCPGSRSSHPARCSTVSGSRVGSRASSKPSVTASPRSRTRSSAAGPPAAIRSSSAALARELRARKLAALLEGEPAVIATANVGCLAHLGAASPVPVRHWIELVDAARSRGSADAASADLRQAATARGSCGATCGSIRVVSDHAAYASLTAKRNCPGPLATLIGIAPLRVRDRPMRVGSPGTKSPARGGALLVWLGD